ncbi:hypothetical protein HYV73_00995 [Candidatus Uhrbacteria bacterium]|nr:hypothetical protein [Candidatus Uhrbacteria bacterium]
MKRFSPLWFLVVGLVFLPSLNNLTADPGGWKPLQAERVWRHDGFKVQRLALSSRAQGPFSLGDNAYVLEEPNGCVGSTCDIVDVTLLKGESEADIEDVSREAFDQKDFAENEGRMLFMRPRAETDRYDVVEVDMSTGAEKTILSPVSFAVSMGVDVLSHGNDYVFNMEAAKKNGAIRQAAVLAYNHAEGEAQSFFDHWTLEREELNDIDGTKAAVKTIFAGGEKEIWLMDSAIVDGYRGSMKVVPGTWTEKKEDIVGLHFLSGGRIEFFRNFTRHTYKPGDEKPLVFDQEQVSWFRPIQEAYQINGTRMAWVNEKDELFLSDDGKVKKLGVAKGGVFTLLDDKLFWDTVSGSSILNFNNGASVSLKYKIRDAQDGVAVGVNDNGEILFHNYDAGKTMVIGFGTNPVLSDRSHAFWRGLDGRIYTATIAALKDMSTAPVAAVRAARTPEDSTVYLLQNGKKYEFPDEETYFSHFRSWSSVQYMSQRQLDLIPDGGTMRFAKGTLIKSVDSPRIYVVGSSEDIRWVTDSHAALQVFGERWQERVIEIPANRLFDYKIGDPVMGERDWE